MRWSCHVEDLGLFWSCVDRQEHPFHKTANTVILGVRSLCPPMAPTTPLCVAADRTFTCCWMLMRPPSKAQETSTSKKGFCHPGREREHSGRFLNRKKAGEWGGVLLLQGNRGVFRDIWHIETREAHEKWEPSVLTYRESFIDSNIATHHHHTQDNIPPGGIQVVRRWQREEDHD